MLKFHMDAKNKIDSSPLYLAHAEWTSFPVDISVTIHSVPLAGNHPLTPNRTAP